MKKKVRLPRIFASLALRESFRNWPQTLAVIAIGAIAVTLFVGLQANSASMESRIALMEESSHPADVYVLSDPHQLKSEDDTELIRSLLGSEDTMESRFYSYCNLESKASLLTVSPSLPYLSTAYDVQASWDSTETDYFYIDSYVAEEFVNANATIPVLGRTATLSFDLSSFGLDENLLKVLDAYTLGGKKNPFREKNLVFHSPVTGIMHHPENAPKTIPVPFLTMMSSYRFFVSMRTAMEESFTPAGVQLIFKEGFYKKLGWGDGNPYGSYAHFPSSNQYLISLKDPGLAGQMKEKVRFAYGQKKVNNLYMVQTKEETSWYSTLKSEVDQATKLTMVFPVVFFAVAILVILTTVRQTIVKRRMEIGAFKALGLRKPEIHGHFLSFTFFYVITASIIGCAIGPILLPFIMAKKYDILYTLPTRTYLFPWGAALASVSVFLVVSLLVTLLITYKEIALKPVESMRPKTIKMRHLGSMKDKAFQSPLRLSSKMAARNIASDPLKSFMVVLGVAGCTALLICGFGIEDTLNYDIANDPYVNSSSSVMAHFLQPTAEEKLQVDFVGLNQKYENHLISSYQPYNHASTEFIHGATSYTTYLFMLGNAVSLDGTPSPVHMVREFPVDEALISTKAAERLGVKKGDVLSFYINGENIQTKIFEVYDAFYGNGVVFHSSSTLLTVPYKEFDTAWMNASPGISEKALAAALKTLDYVPVVDTFQEWMSRIEGMVSSIHTMTAAVKVFAMLLAIVVLYNLGLLNYRERVREMATLKVLGFRSYEIALSLLLECLSMTFLGILGGLALGFPFMTLVLKINQIEIIHYIYHISPLTYVFGFLFTFLIALAVNFALSLRIRKIEAVTSLKSVE